MNRTLITIGMLLVVAALVTGGCAATSFHIRDWPHEPYPVAQNQSASTFWEAAQNFDTAATIKAASSHEEIRFAKALKAVVDNRPEEAIALADSLCFSHIDSVMHRRSREVLESALMSMNRWQDLATLYNRDSLFNDSANSIRPLIEAFAAAPAPQIDFPALPFAMPIELNAPGLPLVEVVVNGHPKKFIVDTGAAFTVLASEFAHECGVQPAENAQVSAGTSTSRRVGIEPAIIDSLRIGKLVIRNHPAVIIQSSDLRLRLLGFLTLFEIDGILGWNAIRELELQIDYQNRQVLLREPQLLQWYPPIDPTNLLKTIDENPITFHRNLFECNQPLVSLTSTSGKGMCCHFFLDTGSNATSITDNYLSRIHSEHLKSRVTLIGGAGGMQAYESKILPHDTLILGRISAVFCNLRTEPHMSDSFFWRDGVLGSDILQNGSILIDCLNGRCEFILTPDQAKIDR